MHGSRRWPGERWVTARPDGLRAWRASGPCSSRAVRRDRAAGRTGSLTVYSGQHVQTTEALVAAFEKKTGITVNIRYDDEDVLADQIVAEGSHSPADVFYTENSPPLAVPGGSRGSSPRSTPRPWPTRPPGSTPPTGKWVGVSARVSVMVYNTSLLKAEPAARPRPWTWPSRSGRARSPSPAPRRTSSPSSPRSPVPTATRRPCTGSRRSRPTPANHTTRTTRPSPTRSTGPGRPGHHQPVLLVPRAGRGGRVGNMHGRSPTSPHGTSATCVDVSGAGILRSSTHQAAAQKFLAFLTSPQGQRIIAHSDSYEYPIASGVTTRSRETPFDRAAAQPHHHRRAGHRRRGDQASARGAAVVSPAMTAVACAGRSGPAGAAAPCRGGTPPPTARRPRCVAVSVAVVLPLVFLVIEAVQVGMGQLAPAALPGPDRHSCSGTRVSLTVVVTLPLRGRRAPSAAWFVERTDLPGRQALGGPRGHSARHPRLRGELRLAGRSSPRSAASGPPSSS